MITKERLEELIGQEATVWVIRSSGVFERKLKNRTFDFDLLSVLVSNLGIPYERWFYCDLYENKEDAEFVAKYHSTRPLEFRPCSYEQIVQTSINYCYTYDFVDTFLIQCQIYVDFEENYICINRGAFTPVVIEDVTKENYIKAVECARKLFLGLKGEEDA